MGPDADSRRRAELAKIHLAQKALGLDEETYRALLWTVARVRSAAELDTHGRRLVLEHMKARGFRDNRRVRPPVDREPLILKIRAMLRAAGRVDAYGDGMARRMFHVDHFEWCTPEQLRKLVAALVYDAKRRAAARQDA